MSLDASPAQYTHSHSHLLTAMKNLDLSKARSIHHAVNFLYETIHDKSTCAFACTNLVKRDDDKSESIEALKSEYPSSVYRWRLNLDVLLKQENDVHAWPLQYARDLFATKNDTQFEGDVLFIGGKQSTRLTCPEYIQNIPLYFLKSRVEMLEGGHFVHQGPESKQCAVLVADHIISQNREIERII